MMKMVMLNNIVSIFKHFNCSPPFFSLFPSRLIRPLSPLRAHLLYLLFISFQGYLVLIYTNLRLAPHNTRLNSLDAAFMSISAVTSSSMSTVEMEVFTNAQLIIITILMLLGGEVFTSMLALFLKAKKETSSAGMDSISVQMPPDDTNPSSLAELGFLPTTLVSPTSADNKSNSVNDHANNNNNNNSNNNTISFFSKLTAVKALAYLVLAYVIVIHLCGSLFVYLYMITVPNAAHLLQSKSIQPSTFSIFLASSSFSNCGFVPTNENMAIFKTNSALLLLVIPQILMGNTFYPICIRILLRFMEFVTKSSLYTYILSNPAGYSHLFSGLATQWFGWTGLVFIMSQVVMLGTFEWGSEAFKGMSWYERLVACLFQSVNSRHSGESVFDLAILSPAILVLFILMMYLPPYFIFMPYGDDGATKDPEEELRRSLESDRSKNKKKKLSTENFLFTDLSYLTIFVILISITERKSLKADPLNFNVLSIVLEVVSAYGNVGFSMGYSCKRQVEDSNPFCEEKTYGFVGRWSNQGKLILIIVMIFGKLKKFSRKGGKAWRNL